MHHPYCRPLSTLPLIEDFLQYVLQVEDYNNAQLIQDIKNCEIEIGNIDYDSPTITSQTNRVRRYRSEQSRWELRKAIVKELLKKKRLKEDNNIILGSGGALPRQKIKKDRTAYIIIGLPASGKSRIANIIADNYGAVILDSDYSKRKIPEYYTNFAGASLTHDESDALIWGGFTGRIPHDFHPLIIHCSNVGMNIVIPKIGYSLESTKKIIETLKRSYNYEVHLTLVSIDRRIATIRALNRYKSTKRYVPLSLIFDGYSNDPILTYYRLKRTNAGLIRSFGKLSTENEIPMIIESDIDNPANIFQI